MDRILYTAAGGAARVMEQQNVISNNLANINTVGFRQQLSAYRHAPFVGQDPALPTRVASVASTPGSHMGQGAMAETGHSLDVAIRGDGWFSVQTPQGEAYTRAGQFTVGQNGQLVDMLGNPVLNEGGGPIEIPDRGTVTFADDGQITALGAGDNPNDIQLLGRLKLVNPPADQLERSENGLFRLAGGGAAPANETIKIAPGFLEMSNVSPAEAMVSMISSARRFELQMKVIQDASANAERANSILSSQ